MNPCHAPTDAETALLGVLELQIERNLEAIRTGHLYRSDAETFEQWLRQRFNVIPADGGGKRPTP